MPSPPEPDDYAIDVLRSMRDDDTVLEAPPDEIFDRIADEVYGGRRANRSRWLAIAAVFALVVLVAGAALLARPADDSDAVAQAELATLDDGDVLGTAQLVEGDDGSLVLQLDMRTNVELASGYLEVWLLDEAATDLVSLGPMPESGEVTLPASIDPDAFPVVDVSFEQYDGDPGHSGDSLVRGTLA